MPAQPVAAGRGGAAARQKRLALSGMVIRRGLGPGDIVNGVERVSRDDLPRLLGKFDQVWQW
jgi:hypothetical protein